MTDNQEVQQSRRGRKPANVARADDERTQYLKAKYGSRWYRYDKVRVIVNHGSRPDITQEFFGFDDLHYIIRMNEEAVIPRVIYDMIMDCKKIDFVQAPADPSNPSAIQPINEIVRPVWNVQFLGEEDLPE